VLSDEWQLKRQYLIDQRRREGRRRIERKKGGYFLNFFPWEGKCEKRLRKI